MDELFQTNNVNNPNSYGLNSLSSSEWAPTIGDLYQSLNYEQEKKLGKLANRYAAGEIGNKEDKLAKLLSKAGLGSIESYFSQPTTYTAPTGLSTQLPENITAQQLADIYRSSDPRAKYETSQQYGLGSSDISKLLGGYGQSYYNPVQTTSGIESILSKGKTDLEDYNLAQSYLQNPSSITDPSLLARAQQAAFAYQNPIQQPIEATAINKKGQTIAGSGQYGYLGGAPILNANIADEILGDKNKASGKDLKKNADILDELGWNFKSGQQMNFLQKGPRVLGINNKMSSPEALKSMDQPDPETGGVSSGRIYLENAAKKIGIDPSSYKTSTDLYGAIERATENLYQVTGQFKQWDPQQAASPKNKANHASVLYREINGKLVPINDPQFFKYEKQNPLIGGFAGDVLKGVSSIPFLPEIAAVAIPGVGPGIYAAMKGTQAVGQGADLEQVAKTAGLSYLAPQIAKGIDAGLPGLMPAGTPALATDALSKGLSSGIITGLATGDLSKAGTAALAGGVRAGITGGLQGLTNLPSSLAKLGSEVLGGAAASAITGQDPKAYAINRLLTAGFGALASAGAEKTGMPTSGPQAEVIKAMLPIIMSKRVTDKDILALGRALKSGTQTV